VTTQHHNVFAGAFVDRSGERRKDPDWLNRALRSDDSRFVPVWGDQCLVAGDPLQAQLLRREQIEPLADDLELIFLGIFHDHPAFAVPYSGGLDAPFAELGEFQELRYLGTVLSADEANLVAHARALVLWHASQVFCGICGSAARPGAAGNWKTGQRVVTRRSPASLSPVRVSKTRYDARCTKKPISALDECLITAHNPGLFQQH